jgi:hypothetical protein
MSPVIYSMTHPLVKHRFTCGSIYIFFNRLQMYDVQVTSSAFPSKGYMVRIISTSIAIEIQKLYPSLNYWQFVGKCFEVWIWYFFWTDIHFYLTLPHLPILSQAWKPSWSSESCYTINCKYHLSLVRVSSREETCPMHHQRILHMGATTNRTGPLQPAIHLTALAVSCTVWYKMFLAKKKNTKKKQPGLR